jgi:hypothetical protein
VKYRSKGGTDEEANLTTACAACHLEGEHEGRLKIVGTAPNATWLLGRKPVLRIDGREKR